ncbi:unnamed protein product [Haemonchus placei]|uniref:Major sperm protein n=1 Tax=Haemonchus placei TaxID=6290 RepID=A0A0N4X414_HAEPC|nr:unnamed protein product [Haemonchus placei]
MFTRELNEVWRDKNEARLANLENLSAENRLVQAAASLEEARVAEAEGRRGLSDLGAARRGAGAASPHERRDSGSRRSSRSGRASGPSLPAKPSELRVEPCELSYKAIGGLKGVNVVNDTQERRFFKVNNGFIVKCSDNMLYRVNPVFGVVEPGKSSRIDILRQNGGAKIDKIVLVTTKAEEGETPSRDVFNQGRNTEMMVLPLLVQE